MKFIDLFCGIGGFHQALKRLNFQCVMACDNNIECQKTYKINYGIEPDKDIRKLDIESIPNFDILCAGFPCQAFSLAGKKLSVNDTRGNLFDYIIKIAKEKQPKFLFLENVKHIKNIDNGKVYRYILESISDIGYHLDEDTIFQLSPHELGIPQHRDRMIFVGIRDDIYNSNLSIEIEKSTDILDVSKILVKKAPEKYKISDELEKVLSIWDEMLAKMEDNQSLSPTILCHEFYRSYFNEEIPKWKKLYIEKNKPIYYKYKPEWDKWYLKHRELLNKREIYGKLEWQVGRKKPNDSIFNYFIQIRQSGIRVKRIRYFPTLVAYVQIPIYGKEKRYLTPLECARLQSFPDDFILPEKDKIAYKQLGNAVNVEVIYQVISQTLKTYGYLSKINHNKI